MIWQRLALVLVVATLLLVLLIKGRYGGERTSVTAFRVVQPPAAWLQLAGDVRHHGVYPLSDINMTNAVIKMAEPLCIIHYNQAQLETVLKKQPGAKVDIACSTAHTSGLVKIEPLAPPQSLLLLGSIPLNSATTDELCLVPGIGPILAQRILLFRQNNGEFEDFDDLLQGKGIAEKKLEILKRYLTI